MKGLTVLSYGGGQDSTTILFKILRDFNFRKKYLKGEFIVVMANTKNEHDHTTQYVDYIKEVCEKKEVPFFLLDPEEYAGKSWSDGLIGFYEEKNVIGSKAFPKTCTDNLKIRPIYKFLEEYIYVNYDLESYGRKSAFYEFKKKYGKINVLLGIAKGEEKRASENGSSGIKWYDECVQKHYPLIEEKMNRKDCQEYLREIGEEIPFPSNCILCPFMSLQELLYLYRYNRSWYDKWVVLEQNKINNNLHKGSKNLGVWGSLKLLPDVLKKAQEKHGHMTKDELIEYKMSHGHCVTSKF